MSIHQFGMLPSIVTTIFFISGKLKEIVFSKIRMLSLKLRPL